ncbi:MAG: hypothetical protein HY681_12115 [Chloroflexi bacterium]|nr:hypothetical protein [Chloroflexota bacterium]
MPDKITETPALFVKQLGIRPADTVQLLNAPPFFTSVLTPALPEGASLLTDGAPASVANIVLLWPRNMADMMNAVNERIALGMSTLSAIWVVIPKKPVAQRRASDLFFQPILDAVLPTGLVDNKTLTFSEEEYGIRFVPRKALLRKG